MIYHVSCCTIVTMFINCVAYGRTSCKTALGWWVILVKYVLIKNKLIKNNIHLNTSRDSCTHSFNNSNIHPPIQWYNVFANKFCTPSFTSWIKFCLHIILAKIHLVHIWLWLSVSIFTSCPFVADFVTGVCFFTLHLAKNLLPPLYWLPFPQHLYNMGKERRWPHLIKMDVVYQGRGAIDRYMVPPCDICSVWTQQSIQCIPIYHHMTLNDRQCFTFPIW